MPKDGYLTGTVHQRHRRNLTKTIPMATLLRMTNVSVFDPESRNKAALTTMDKLDLLLEMYEAQQKEIKDKVTSNENNRQQQSGNMARCISKALRC